MGNVTRSSSEVYTSDSEKGFAINHSTPAELDAGAKFVLVSRGEPAFLCSCYKTKKKKKTDFDFDFSMKMRKECSLMNCPPYCDVCRIMAALWVSFDYIYCGSCASYSSFLLHSVGLGRRSALVDPCCRHHILLLQPFICCLRISCTTRASPVSLQGHG